MKPWQPHFQSKRCQIRSSNGKDKLKRTVSTFRYRYYD